VWAKAVNPADPEHLLAVTKAREIVDRQAKLYGLDAPTEVIVHNPTATEIEAWVAKVVSVGAPPVPEYDIITGQVLSVTDEVGTKAGEQ
jgi:peptidyl-tRNA hydrolase